MNKNNIYYCKYCKTYEFIPKDRCFEYEECMICGAKGKKRKMILLRDTDNNTKDLNMKRYLI